MCFFVVQISDVAGQWGRAADKVVDEFADRMHKSAETLADFVSDLKDESNVALCKQCSSFQKCLDDSKTLRERVRPASQAALFFCEDKQTDDSKSGCNA